MSTIYSIESNSSGNCGPLPCRIPHYIAVLYGLWIGLLVYIATAMQPKVERSIGCLQTSKSVLQKGGGLLTSTRAAWLAALIECLDEYFAHAEPEHEVMHSTAATCVNFTHLCKYELKDLCACCSALRRSSGANFGVCLRSSPSS